MAALLGTMAAAALIGGDFPEGRHHADVHPADRLARHHHQGIALLSAHRWRASSRDLTIVARPRRLLHRRRLQQRDRATPAGVAVAARSVDGSRADGFQTFRYVLLPNIATARWRAACSRSR
jgi:hypothetical protein